MTSSWPRAPPTSAPWASSRPPRRGSGTSPWTTHGLIPEALEEALVDCRANGDRVKFLYTVPNFHNPAGVTLSEPRREAIVALAEKHDLLVIEDNPYGLLGFEHEPLRALRARNSQRVIYLGSFSKTFSPGPAGGLGARAARRPGEAGAGHRGAGALPAVADPVRRRPVPGHPALARADQAFTELYRERRDACLESLAALMPAGTAWTRPEGGFYVWLKLPHGLDAKLMQPRAVNAHVAYVPGIGFFADGNGREYMRLSYCYPEPDQIREGVRRLARVIEAELDLHSTFDAVDTGTFRAVGADPRPRSRDDRRPGEQRHLRGRAGMTDSSSTGTRTRHGAAPAARRRPGRRADLRARGQPFLGHPGVGGAGPGRRRRGDPRRRRRPAARPGRRARRRGLHRPARGHGGGRRPAGRPGSRRRALRRLARRRLPAGLGQARGQVRRPRRPACRRPTGWRCRTAPSASSAPAPSWT